MSQKLATPVLLAEAIEFHRIKYKVELNRLELENHWHSNEAWSCSVCDPEQCHRQRSRKHTGYQENQRQKNPRDTLQYSNSAHNITKIQIQEKDTENSAEQNGKQKKRIKERENKKSDSRVKKRLNGMQEEERLYSRQNTAGKLFDPKGYTVLRCFKGYTVLEIFRTNLIKENTQEETKKSIPLVGELNVISL